MFTLRVKHTLPTYGPVVGSHITAANHLLCQEELSSIKLVNITIYLLIIAFDILRWDVLTLWCHKSTIVHMHCNAGKAKHPLKSSAKNMQSYGQLFKSRVFCRVHWALISGSKGLSTEFMSKGTITS
jgi:hypothetical protein